MTWNHRVIRKIQKRETTDDDVYLGIHEVFYDENGVPNMVTVDAVEVGGDDLKGLAQTLEWMRKSLSQPILDYTDFEEGGKYYTGDENGN